MKDILIQKLKLVLERAALEGNSQVVLFGKEDGNLLAWMTDKNIDKAAELIFDYVGRMPDYDWIIVDVYARGNESQAIVCESLGELMGEPYATKTRRGYMQITR